MTETLSEQEQAISEIVARWQTEPGALLPILHDVQNRFGYVPQNAVELIATGLNLSRAEVHGVISFYHHFATKPRGRHVLEVCRAESCQAVGGRSLEAHAKQKLGVDWHGTTPDGQYTLEPVYCLGNCACSPAVRTGNQVFGRVTPERFDAILDDLATVPVNLV